MRGAGFRFRISVVAGHFFMHPCFLPHSVSVLALACLRLLACLPAAVATGSRCSFTQNRAELSLAR